MINNEKYLITGAAGFIGASLAQRLLKEGKTVMGIDNINDYYDVNLKRHRLEILKKYDGFSFVKGDISEKKQINSIFKEYKPDFVINLAAQTGVRYSLENPDEYIRSNIVGFFNILEESKNISVKHLVYASSSSVYGEKNDTPFCENQMTDAPVSLYAVTKKSNELMAYTYSRLHNIPCTGLRFFTVYGPMGRPDMAYYDFVQKYFKGEPLKIFNDGDYDNDLCRDFTYIDDVIASIVMVIKEIPHDIVPHIILNVGNSNPVKLMDFIDTLECCLSVSLGRKAEFEKKFEPLKPGDVHATYACTEMLEKLTGYRPKTPLYEGLQNFTDWYVSYYNCLGDS